MDWRDTSRDKMEAVGRAQASITVKTELFLGLDEDVRTNWNRTSCLSRRNCSSQNKDSMTRLEIVSSRSCTSFPHFPSAMIEVYFYQGMDGKIWFKSIGFIFFNFDIRSVSICILICISIWKISLYFYIIILLCTGILLNYYSYRYINVTIN